MLQEIMEFNKEFVKSKGYEKYLTNKYPDKKIAIISCMDTRLLELIPAALGLRNGDVKMIKNAGGIISHPFGSAVRSLLVAIYELGVEEVMVIGHTDCGAQHMDSQRMIRHMKERGISPESIEMMKYCGVHIDSWLSGFEDTEKAIKGTVVLIKEHPLIPKDIVVNGFVINSITGELKMII